MIADLRAGWRDATLEKPKMHTDSYIDFDDTEVDYEISDPVLAFTREQEQVVAKCCYDECGKLWWFTDDGLDLKVTHWQPLPEGPCRGGRHENG